MKKIISLILTVCLLGAVTAAGIVRSKTEPAADVLPYSEEEADREALANVIPSLVLLIGNGHYGSGVIYQMSETELILATNRHVLQYFDENSYVTFFNGKTAPGEPVGSSETADVGFVRVAASAFSEAELGLYREVCKDQEACDALQVNDLFYLLDITGKIEEPVIIEGSVLDGCRYLEEYGREMLYGDAPVHPGMSGSGLFDSQGRYLGMLSGGTGQNEIAAVPLSAIEEAFAATGFSSVSVSARCVPSGAQ